MNRNSFLIALVAVAALAPFKARAQTTVGEDFTGTSTTNSWYYFNGACLTAGSAAGSEPSGGVGGKMPGCVAIGVGGGGPLYYNEPLVGGYNGVAGNSQTLPDPAGHGALRFTNGSWPCGGGYCGGFSQNGGIVSATPFPTGQGISVTFKTVTYRGNSGGAGNDGADGMSFFLMDASQLNTATITGVGSGNGNGLGSWGGSLGYTCSNANPPYNGLIGGYIGLGIDEYGNFLNGATNTLGETGTTASGDNTASGGGYQPGRIGMRGAGNVAWNALTAAYGTNPNNPAAPYYPASLAQSCVNGGGTWNASANACVSCPGGYVYTSSGNTCASSPAQCSSGTYNAGTGLCETCSSGTYSSGLNNCQTCSSGTYDSTTNLCESCSTGSYDSNTNTCNSCATGTYDPNTQQCESCTATYTYNPNVNQCQICSTGTLNVSGAGSCSRGGRLSEVSPSNPSLTQGTPQSSAVLAPSTSAPLTSSPGFSNPDSFNAVQNTCKTGNLWNYLVVTAPTLAGAASLSNSLNVPASGSGLTPILDYGAIPNAYAVLPAGTQIANEAAMSRGAATPILYELKISQNGLLSLSYSINGGAYQQVIKSQSITASNGPLPANFLFGFAGSTGGSSNVHEILCFKAAPATTAASSAGVSERQSAKLETGAQAYFAFYNPNGWTGKVTASSLSLDQYGNVVVAATPNWDASCVLTGVKAGSNCSTTGVAGPIAAEAPTSRVVLTWNGTQGIPFEYSDLTAAQQGLLTAGDVASAKCNSTTGYAAADRLNYLRGDRTCEISPSGVGLFRSRSGSTGSVLADIIDSSPAWVGPPVAPYPGTWTDRLYSAATNAENASGAQTYVAYTNANETRLNVVYTGANDGLLHGFRSGSYNSNGTFCSNSTNCTGTVTPNDGQEVLAYMPGAIVQTIHNNANPAVDYSNSQYGHNFFVDATPGTGDLFYNGAWHTWVVGGLGPGGNISVAFTAVPSGSSATLTAGFAAATGTYLLTFSDNETRAATFTNNSTSVTWSGGLTGSAPALTVNAVATMGAIYALDVTNPTTFSELGAVPASLVMGEWTAPTISCAGATSANGGANCGHNLGATYGTPNIRRLHNGDWAVIFGNGIGSASGDAGIYIMTVNPTTTATTFYYLSTSTGSIASPNGIAFATPADLDGDHITDYVYAGDLQGNVWRFDLTSSNPASWAVTPGPVFTAPAGQPITTSIVAASGAPYAGMQQYLMILFGTGEKFPLSNLNPASYATGTQSLYGVWDWNMTNWNSISSVQYAAQAASATTGLAGANHTVKAANLEQQVVTINGTTGNRDIMSNQTVCWAGTTTCSGTNSEYGWYINLPGTQEQVIYSPELVAQALTVNSIVPATNDPTSCVVPTDTGFTYVLSALTGAAFNEVFLPPGEAANPVVNTNPAYLDANAIAMQTNATGSSFISGNSSGTMYLIYETNQASGGSASCPTCSSIQGGTLGLNLPPNTTGHRLSWVERR
jgi:type IV pilus assembly protein PilY1